uniref:FBA_2 domain-containing protein n=1 Tax=Caenorhabditis tropicalis TaxID=1561998 RepID=A0A1I7TWV3_9PELO
MLHLVQIDYMNVLMNMEKVRLKDVMNLCFEDLIEGLKMVTEYFCSLFGKDIIDVRVSSHLNPYGPVIIMEWIIRRQKGIDYFATSCKKTSNSVAEYIFDKLNHARGAFIKLSLSPKFKKNFKFEGMFLDLRQCPWFTLDSLLSVNCERLDVKGSRLTNTEMNSFLKHWITSDLKFKRIVIEMEVIRLDDLFSEIEVTQVASDVQRTYKHKCNHNFTINGGFDIKRNDEVTATIDHDGTEQKKTFSMFVWPRD